MIFLKSRLYLATIQVCAFLTRRDAVTAAPLAQLDHKAIRGRKVLPAHKVRKARKAHKV
jgi:hypothetical protein